MSDEETTFQEVKDELARFNSKRDWDKFHNPKDLAVSISIEAAELLENFQWKDTLQPEDVKKDLELMSNIEDEAADMLIYLLILCNRLDLDASKMIKDKIEKNRERFKEPGV